MTMLLGVMPVSAQAPVAPIRQSSSASNPLNTVFIAVLLHRSFVLPVNLPAGVVRSCAIPEISLVDK
jgi:hypothetical protein